MVPDSSILKCALFETDLGFCAIAWSERGVRAFQLPENGAEETLNAIQSRVGIGQESRLEPVSKPIVDRLVRHLAGSPQKFDYDELDLVNVSDFAARVYKAAMDIQPGSTLSYGELASRIGSAGAARAVGRALGANPVPVIVPCHRIIGRSGHLTGFSAFGACHTKAQLLSIEGALVLNS